MSVAGQGSGDGPASKRRDGRRRAERRGWRAEALCRLALRLRGYRVLARRWRCPLGEVDIVARRGAVLVFVEVKARETLAEGLAAISPAQRRRVEAAAAAFLAGRRDPGAAPASVRFDVMVVVPRRWPVHLRDAWRPGW